MRPEALAVVQLTERVLGVRQLTAALSRPVTVACAATDPVEVTQVGTLLDRVAARVDAGPFQVTPAGTAQLDTFSGLVSRWLDLSGPALDVPGDADVVQTAVEQAVGSSFGAFCRTAEVTTADGARIVAYSAGDPRRPAVVLSSACGMPALLSERWVRHLAAEHHVLTWESRGLFDLPGDPGGDPAGFDRIRHDVTAQATDLVAVMDHFGVPRAHLMGLCGGAVIAVVAAALVPSRFDSMSLWHGDFELGPTVPKTEHQQNLSALMDFALDGRSGSAAVHQVLCASVLQDLPADLAHLVVYPYANAELWHRYSILNGAIMHTDVRGYLGRLVQPALVVTSDDDATAHPRGSVMVARGLTDATVHVAAHGDHISLFRGPRTLLELASDFIGQGRS